MVGRFLLRPMFAALVVMPVLALAESNDDALRSFSEAASSLPAAALPKAKAVSKQHDSAEITRLRARIRQLEKQQLAASSSSKTRDDVQQQLSQLQLKQKQQLAEIAQLKSDLKKAPMATEAAVPLSEPKSDAERDGYTLGQSIASNAVVQLQMVKDVGLTISMDQLIAGLTTQLKTGTSAIGGEEMSHRYAQMQAAMNKGMGPLIEKGYAQLDKQVENRKSLRSENGVRWFAVKSVKAKLIPDQQVEVSVKISTLGGKVINDFSDDKVPFDNHLPPLLYDGMSLTGQGGAVEGWALAKDIVEREPLPPWVAPYDVIHYQLAIK